MLYLKHPAWFWLKRFEKNKLPEITENQQAIFDAGHKFESIVEKGFKDAVRLGFKDFREYLTLPKRTDKELKRDTKIMLQGSVIADNLLCIFDVLEKTDNGYNLYEIKSSTKVKEEHLYDLAFQREVLRRKGIDIVNIYLIHSNRDYVRDGEIEYELMSKTELVTPEVESLEEITNKYLEEVKGVAMGKGDIPSISPSNLGLLGSMNEWLEIYGNIREIDKYSIYRLGRINKDNIKKLEEDGIETIDKIPNTELFLSSKQKAQVEVTKTNTARISEKDIKLFVDKFKYPIYFLDYETVADVVPMYDGTSPYDQVPFQYSLHILHEDGKLEHKEFLHQSSESPIEHIKKRLMEDIGDKGSVVVWYAAFEKGCNKFLCRNEKGEKLDFFDNLNDRIIDLMEPFKNDLYLHKDFFGSASIKKVLPVLVPDLSYSNLDIKEGETAQRVWRQTFVEEKEGLDKEKVAKDLLKYCELDTLAMVEIFKVLKNI